MAEQPESSSTDKAEYLLVKEEHCKGHEEDRELTVYEYRKEQKVEEFDKLNCEWLQLILKKRSAGPTVGKSSDMSLQLFFMAPYDIDRSRRFMQSDSFQNSYELRAEVLEELTTNDITLMQFGMHFLKQVLFGETIIPVKAGATEKRTRERGDIAEIRRKAEIEAHKRREAAKLQDQ